MFFLLSLIILHGIPTHHPVMKRVELELEVAILFGFICPLGKSSNPTWVTLVPWIMLSIKHVSNRVLKSSTRAGYIVLYENHSCHFTVHVFCFHSIL